MQKASQSYPVRWKSSKYLVTNMVIGQLNNDWRARMPGGWKNKASHSQQKRKQIQKPSKRQGEATVTKILLINSHPWYSNWSQLFWNYLPDICICAGRQTSEFPKPQQTHDKALWTMFHLIHFLQKSRLSPEEKANDETAEKKTTHFLCSFPFLLLIYFKNRWTGSRR